MDEALFAVEQVRNNVALLHPLVLGELLLGGLSRENESLLQGLPTMQLPPIERIYPFIKDSSLAGKGIGWVDAVLLCSALEEQAVLATFDKTLRSCAKDLGIPCLPAL
jgi:hypothetical protein